MEKIKKSDKEWKNILTPEQYHILREKGTEAPFSGRYVKTNKKGNYFCAACSNLLFSSGAKFASPCGWPSFYEAEKESVEFNEDSSHEMHRIEVTCKKCGGHLGHIFGDGPKPTGKRFCINSRALELRENEK